MPLTPAPPGHPPGPMNMRHPGMQFGPRGMGNRPDGPMRFLGPGGPRQGHPMGPHFPGPDGMGPRHRGPMMMRMQRPPGPGRVRRMDPDPYYQNWSVSACSLVRLGSCIGSFSSRSTTICRLALTVNFLTCFTFQTLGLARQKHQVWLAIFFRIGRT